VATLVYFSAALIGTFLKADDVSQGEKVFASIVPQAAIQQGSIVYANFECTGVGLNSDTATWLYNDYSVYIALTMMTASFFIFTLLGLYLDKVIPSTYGMSRSPYFCLTASYWGCRR
jgi:hypothetical protein